MPYTFTLATTIPASAQEIYDAWLDSVTHSKMTGGAAIMSDKIGAEVSAWDGYITGRNLDLVPSERIVQAWRTNKFSGQHGDSIITLTLQKSDDGTLLTLMHSNVPDGQTSYELGGWQTHYFEPMHKYFSGCKKIRMAGSLSPRLTKARKRPGRAKTKSKKAGGLRRSISVARVSGRQNRAKKTKKRTALRRRK